VVWSNGLLVDVSTLLEILEKSTWCRNVSTATAAVSTLLEILAGRRPAHGPGPRPRIQVSTLLEILVYEWPRRKLTRKESFNPS
jgi:hypothetical protein